MPALGRLRPPSVERTRAAVFCILLTNVPPCIYSVPVVGCPNALSSVLDISDFPGKTEIAVAGTTLMRVPRPFLFSDGCLTCMLRREGDFCSLPHPLLHTLHGLGHLTLYPPDAVLMEEQHVPPGVYIVCSGRVKMSVEAKDGKTVILKVAGERQVLGLSSVFSGSPSPIAVTTIDPCQIKFVDREDFLRLVERSTDAALACARLLGHEIGTAFRDVHDLLLARSSTEKLARLLLSWASKDPPHLDLHVAANFTHEEIAQMIGSSRETVTRLLSDLKRKELIRVEGSTLVISDRVALQTMAS
jgi:CRP/FNR family cyclic AMP-dependent transcriptional regulator